MNDNNNNIDLSHQKRGFPIIILMTSDDLDAIEAACDDMNVSRSSLLYELLRDKTEDFTNFQLPEGVSLRRRKQR